VPVPVCVEERAARAPAPGGYAGAGRLLRERAVPLVPEEKVLSPVGDVEIQAAVAVVVARAHAVAPGGGVHARLRGDVLDTKPAQIAVEDVPVRHALPRGRELGCVDEVDVEAPVAVVVEEGEAAAAGLQD